ncbi:MAG: polysaccharide deacetylase family protein [Pseudomonadota bacterium]
MTMLVMGNKKNDMCKLMNPIYSRRLTRRLPILLAALLFAGCASTSPEKPLPYPPAVLPAASAPALDPIAPTVVRHGSRKTKLIALTFDACSTHAPSGYDPRIARTLIEQRVPATLFLGGKWIQEHPAEARELATNPLFELGNHTYLHPHPTRVSPERLRQEIDWTQNALYQVSGRQATLFRAPYGEIDYRVVKIAADAGLTTVQFDLASGDPDKRINRQKLADYVSGTARNGSIVVMHINHNGKHTAAALPEIIRRLRARGFEFVTVSELMARAQPLKPDPAQAKIKPARPIDNN